MMVLTAKPCRRSWILGLHAAENLLGNLLGQVDAADAGVRMVEVAAEELRPATVASLAIPLGLIRLSGGSRRLQGGPARCDVRLGARPTAVGWYPVLAPRPHGPHTLLELHSAAGLSRAGDAV